MRDLFFCYNEKKLSNPKKHVEKLLNYLKNYSLWEALRIEKSDIQFKALEKLFLQIEDKDLFLPLILLNATVSYLLSSSWEEYWEEFSNYFSKISIKKEDIFNKFLEFLKNAKGNKRLQNHKRIRLKKLMPFLESFIQTPERYTSDFLLLQREITKEMRQKPDAKTVVYTVKMLSYGVRIQTWGDIVLPFEIPIPIDSRLTKLYELSDSKLKIKDFYTILSKQTQIPPIHLDGILWTNYQEILTHLKKDI